MGVSTTSSYKGIVNIDESTLNKTLTIELIRPKDSNAGLFTELNRYIKTEYFNTYVNNSENIVNKFEDSLSLREFGQFANYVWTSDKTRLGSLLPGEGNVLSDGGINETTLWNNNLASNSYNIIITHGSLEIDFDLIIKQSSDEITKAISALFDAKDAIACSNGDLKYNVTSKTENGTNYNIIDGDCITQINNILLAIVYQYDLVRGGYSRTSHSST